jgi:glycosyltransferase involved in cell wall biosynthesis
LANTLDPQTKTRFKILLLGTQMTVAGAQEVLLTQARWFHHQGYPVTAAFFYDKDGLAGDWQAAHPFPVLDLQARDPQRGPVRNFFRLFGSLYRLYRLMRREQFTVVEAFTPHSNLLGIPLAWLCGVPVRVPTHHSMIEGSSKLLWRMHGWLVNSPLSSCLVAVSGRVRRMAVEDEGARPDRVKVIQNGIETPQLAVPAATAREQIRTELAIPPHGSLMLTVARFTIQKGHTYLLDAIPQVLARHPQAIFALAGEGPHKAEMQAKARELGIAHALRFLGNRADIPELLAAADVFVMPSLWEGLPMALLEAMSMELPVVVTEVEGVEDMIEPGKNGLMVPVKDVDGIAASIVRLLDDPAERARLGQAARKLLESEFTVDRMCADYERLFLEIYAKHHPEA